MLVLSRKAGQSVLIGEDIRVEVLWIGNQVRLGVEAPDEVKVLRSELEEEPKHEVAA